MNARDLPSFTCRKLAWLDEAPSGWAGLICGVLAFIGPLALYAKTGMREPSINGDYFKMAYIGLVWGIPHATGFPLYLLLNGIVSHIPIDGQTFRVMLISAVSLALALHFLYRIGRLLGYPPLLSLAGALVAATGRPVWFQGVITDVYALHILFLTSTIWALLKWQDTRDDRWILSGLWLFLLSLGNHPTTVFAVPGFLLFMLMVKPTILLAPRFWLHALCGMLVVAALYGYIYLRSFAPPPYNECLINGDFKRFLGYITAQDYRTYWGREKASVEQLWDAFAGFGIKTLGKAGWFAVWAGMAASFIRRPKSTVPVLFAPAGLIVIAFFFRDHEPESWLAPFYPFAVLLALSVPMLMVDVIRRWPRLKETNAGGISQVAPTTVTAIVIVLLCLQTAVNLKNNYSGLDLSGPSEQCRRAVRIVNAVQTPALIVTPGYHEDQFILFALFTDADREVRAHPWTDRNSPEVPIAVVDPWNPETARRALAAGSHVYVFREDYDRARADFRLQPVDTGTDAPELYEVLPSPGPP